MPWGSIPHSVRAVDGRLNDDELYERSLSTLVESWRYSATGSPGAEVIETTGAASAVFPAPPERGFLNNAVLTRELGEAGTETGAALEAIERAYAEHGVERFAVWVHEPERDTARAVVECGYRYDSYTRDMGMALTDLADLDTSMLELAEAS